MLRPKLLFPILAVATLAAAPAEGACPPLLDRTMTSLMDQPTPLCRFQGKVVLVVNTASQCGYTRQYKGLEALYRRYRDKGLVVLGFPSNDFGGQEPGSSQDIAQFCEVNYGVTFPVFEKSVVKAAKDINPLYADLAAKTGERPKWNFHKYLIDRKGEKVLSFESAVTPEDRRLVSAVERMLDAR